MKHRRTREIVIELTSLLDVVMILIFAVLLQNSELLEKKDKEIAKVEAEYAGLQEDNAGLQNKIDQLLGEKDKLLDEKDKLAAELEEALNKLDKDNIDELWEKLEKLDSQVTAYEAIKNKVTIYHINIIQSYNSEIKLYDRIDYSFGLIDGDEKKSNTAYKITNFDGEMTPEFEKLKIDLYADMKEQIKANLPENGKYFYIVVTYIEGVNIDALKSMEALANRLSDEFQKNGINNIFYSEKEIK